MRPSASDRVEQRPRPDPFWPSGTVYGTALNFREELTRLGARVDSAPYKAAPRAPVLFVKTANTWSPSGRPVVLPEDVDAVEVGASVALVVGPARFRPDGGPARLSVAGYVLVSDLALPHTSLFRPPVKYKCLDGFLGIGSVLVPTAQAGDPADFVLDVAVDGVHCQTVRFNALVRDATALLADVAESMALQPGDLLLLGSDADRPRLRAGQQVEIRMAGRPQFDRLVQPLTRDRGGP